MLSIVKYLKREERGCSVLSSKEGREGMLSIVKYLKREERGCSVLSSI